MQNGVAAVLITDSTAGFLMKQGKIDAVLVGADRIAANGDTANKIGTYSLAVLARNHQVPFYVVAPFSTFDLQLESGDQIPIETRPSSEVTHLKGLPLAPEGVQVYAPAFDVTPNELISAIVTDRGILRAPYRHSIENVRELEQVNTEGMT
jgi:methylthioribose-1-phosphate isomerase